MFNLGWFEILLIVVLVVLLFGRNKISDLMGDVAKGIKSFKKGLSDDESETVKRVEAETKVASDQFDAAKKEKAN